MSGSSSDSSNQEGDIAMSKGVPTYTHSTQMRTKIFQNKKKYMIFLLRQNKIIHEMWNVCSAEGFSKNNNFDKFECNFAYHQKMSGHAPDALSVRNSTRSWKLRDNAI